MKYIITEEQDNLLRETDANIWLRRRLDLTEIDSIINSEINKFSDLCESFDDADEYVEAIIYNSINELYNTIELPEEYLEQLDEIAEKYLKQMYEGYLIDIFNENCN
jgi:hypothetical protein